MKMLKTSAKVLFMLYIPMKCVLQFKSMHSVYNDLQTMDHYIGMEFCQQQIFLWRFEPARFICVLFSGGFGLFGFFFLGGGGPQHNKACSSKQELK